MKAKLLEFIDNVDYKSFFETIRDKYEFIKQSNKDEDQGRYWTTYILK